MSIFLNLNLKKNKKLIYILKNIYGLGSLRSKLICVDLGYNYDVKSLQLTQRDFNKVNSLVTLKYRYLLQSELKKKVYSNISFMKVLKTYRGIRHTYKLPVNGQRTRNNAKTRRWLR